MKKKEKQSETSVELNEQFVRDNCCFYKCTRESAVIYYGVGLCDVHFSEVINTGKVIKFTEKIEKYLKSIKNVYTERNSNVSNK